MELTSAIAKNARVFHWLLGALKGISQLPSHARVRRFVSRLVGGRVVYRTPQIFFLGLDKPRIVINITLKVVSEVPDADSAFLPD